MDVQRATRARGGGEWADRDRISAITSCQHGAVTFAQLINAGLGREAIRGFVRRGELLPAHRGVYLVGPGRESLAYEHAALLACGPGAVLSHASAACFHKLLPYPAERTPVCVTVSSRHRARDPYIRVYRNALARSEWWIRDGLRVTTPLRTLIDLAAGSPRALEPALREALARRHLTVPALRRAVEARPGRRGTGRLRRLLDSGLGPTRSDSERDLLRLIRRARLPMPETNARVGRWEVDMVWREQRLVVEVDAYSTHASPSAFEADHERDVELRAVGYAVLRFTARQIAAEPEAVVAAIARELAS